VTRAAAKRKTVAVPPARRLLAAALVRAGARASNEMDDQRDQHRNAHGTQRVEDPVDEIQVVVDHQGFDVTQPVQSGSAPGL
jgi:hypothetical protein